MNYQKNNNNLLLLTLECLYAHLLRCTLYTLSQYSPKPTKDHEGINKYFSKFNLKSMHRIINRIEK